MPIRVKLRVKLKFDLVYFKISGEGEEYNDYEWFLRTHSSL